MISDQSSVTSNQKKRLMGLSSLLVLLGLLSLLGFKPKEPNKPNERITLTRGEISDHRLQINDQQPLIARLLG